MKNILRWFFPPRGRVQSVNQNAHEWEIEVSYLGYITIIGKGFRLPMGTTVKAVLALEVNRVLHTDVGFVSRYDNVDADPNHLRFVGHSFAVTVERDKLETLA